METSWKNTYQQIEVEKLDLDLNNPRTNTGGHQKIYEVIKELLDENIIELIESISLKGYAAVSVAMVIKENNKNVVIDGNRRLLAVKVLNNPNIIKKFVPINISNFDFEKIKQLSNSKKEEVRDLTAIIYPSRKDAEHEMSILHLDGEAVKKWKPLRQYRYFQNRAVKEKDTLFDLSESLGINIDRIRKGLITIQLYNFAKEKINLGKLHEKVFNDKDFKTDKFQKTVVNEEGERFLGYSFDQEKCTLIIENTIKFTEHLKKVLLELYNEKSPYFLSAQYPTKNRAEFFKTIEPQFLTVKENKKTKQVLNDKNDEKEAQERSDQKPKGLFRASNVPYKLKSSTLRILYDELKDIEVKRFSNATHDLLRSFLECSLAEYLTQIEEYKKVQKSNEHNPKLGEMLTHVINKNIIDDQDIIDILKDIKADWDKPYSIERMNKVNHNKNYASSESDVRVTWGKLEPFFKIILNPKKKKKL